MIKLIRRLRSEFKMRPVVKALIEKVEKSPQEWRFDCYSYFTSRKGMSPKMSVEINADKIRFRGLDADADLSESFALTRREERAVRALHNRLCAKTEDTALYNKYLDFLNGD